MKVFELIKGLNANLLHADAETEVRTICSDSRKVQEGDLFIALKGSAADGKDYLDQALQKGAAAAIQTDREGLALIADRFYGHPSGKLKLIGITGTNGKTTTVTLLLC